MGFLAHWGWAISTPVGVGVLLLAVRKPKAEQTPDLPELPEVPVIAVTSAPAHAQVYTKDILPRLKEAYAKGRLLWVNGGDTAADDVHRSVVWRNEMNQWRHDVQVLVRDRLGDAAMLQFLDTVSVDNVHDQSRAQELRVLDEHLQNLTSIMGERFPDVGARRGDVTAEPQARPKTWGETRKLREVFLAVGVFVERATNMLLLDEWPQGPMSDEPGWIDSAIRLEASVTETFSRLGVKFPDEQQRRLFPPIAPVWKSGAATPRGAHGELFSASYQRLSMQREAFRELLAELEKTEGVR